jgi:hypothetical protein
MSDSDTVPAFTAVLVFNDPTPGSIILNRIDRPAITVASNYTDLADEDAGDFADLVTLISRKMVSVWKHLQEYHAVETDLRQRFGDPSMKHHVYSQELFEEFDVFVVQIKSTLDHLVKVMRPMLGRNKWTMHTFSGKGETVLASLQRNTPRKHAGIVKSMEHFLFNDRHKMWLADIIDSRDRTNHCQEGGLKIEKFAVFRNPDGTIHVPIWSSDQTLGHAMDAVWNNFFHFVEDFVMLALQFRMRVDEFSLFRKEEPLTSPKSSWAVLSKADGEKLIASLGGIAQTEQSNPSKAP